MWERIQPKLARMVVSLIGAFMTMKGISPDTSWQDVPALLTPLAAAGLVLVAISAWNGTKKFQVSPPKHIGRKP